MIQSTTLRPGLLVSLSVRTTGNVRYITETIESEHVTEEGEARASWKTDRIVYDPDELDASKTARGKARQAVRRVCTESAFGLLCPEDKADKLEAAMKEARAIAEEFNATAKLSRIGVYILTGRIAADDVEAVKAIKSEISGLMEEMSRGIRTFNPDAIRKAADKAKEMAGMLSADGAERVKIAVDVARKVAKEIKKAGDVAALEVDQIALEKMASQRTAFLDLDEFAPMQAPQMEAPVLDLVPETEDERIDRENDEVAQDIANQQNALDLGEDDAPTYKTVEPVTELEV